MNDRELIEQLRAVVEAGGFFQWRTGPYEEFAHVAEEMTPRDFDAAADGSEDPEDARCHRRVAELMRERGAGEDTPLLDVPNLL